jgi:hypothetical protein
VLKYYWKLLAQVPNALLNAADFTSNWLFVLGVVVLCLVLLFFPAFGAKSDQFITQVGNPQPWAAIPMLLLVFWALLRANYATFAAMETRALDAEEALQASQALLDRRAEIRDAIDALNPFITAGNRLLEMYGRPWSPGQPPMRFVEQGLPALNDWYAEIAPVMTRVAPDFMGTWNNDGQIFEGTDQKATAIQQLEGRLGRLGHILAELRSRL